MIDLKELRRRVSGDPTDQGVYGPTWLNPREAVALLDMLDAANLDAARYQWLRDDHIGDDPESINLDRAKTRGLDAAIDAAMAAAKGEQA